MPARQDPFSRIWARKWLFLLAVVPAVLVTIVVNYSVSGSGISEKDQPYGTATAQIYIDQARSALGDASVVPEALANRATVYAELAKSPAIERRAASLAGVPVGSFAVVAVQASRDTVATSLSSGPNPAVFLAPGSGAPLLAITAQAPGAPLAQRLADGMSQALRDYVAQLQRTQRVPAQDQIRLRQLGQAQGSEVFDKASLTTVIGTGIAVWVVLVVLIVVLDLLIGRARTERLERPGASTA